MYSKGPSLPIGLSANGDFPRRYGVIYWLLTDSHIFYPSQKVQGLGNWHFMCFIYWQQSEVKQWSIIQTALVGKKHAYSFWQSSVDLTDGHSSPALNNLVLFITGVFQTSKFNFWAHSIK